MSLLFSVPRLTRRGLLATGLWSGVAAGQEAPPEFSVVVQNGLLTAVFADGTTDVGLTSALPMLSAKSVQAVSLRGAPVRDIRALTGLATLRSLDICGSLVRDATSLAGLTSLQQLNLQFLPIGDLRPLVGMTGLRVLNLSGTDIRDIAPLSGLRALQELVIAVTKVRDLTPLAGLTAMAVLDIAGTADGSFTQFKSERHQSV